ncbi:nicotinate-nucleotide--dimethylbenzimidazole phosphoribosyltransferase [Halococcoides cellulosivorans]|uniref:UPF0284 protein HARCEL1_03780 n=1 Tax=Halococcoides cellulosivorans TaxID=1679096 RepID=A0A2R4WZE6_9EURY|nr:TIGR00303 family protein [Halococcoides cellulosivorans]AWB26894.1 TIGR00303 family protein [Halococcoides cellulosivorans]
MKFVLTIGSTATARIDGISAAGATPELVVQTPSADAEILSDGEPTEASVVPVSPSGCPTPAVVTRAAAELLGFETVVVDAGTASPTTASTVALPGDAGRDIREPIAVAHAREKFETARAFGRSLPDEEVVLAETVPGGTTTAMAVLTALGEPTPVSSSLPANPIALKRRVVADALDASDLSEGGAAGDPLDAVRCVGDPVLAGLAGLAVGAIESGTTVRLGGGTQMSAVAALVRQFGVEDDLSQWTTVFVADDPSADVERLADAFDLSLTVTDPEFDSRDHPAMAAFARGEAKEGVGMGGALALVASHPNHDMCALHDRIATVYDRLLADVPDGHPAAEHARRVGE